MLGRGGASNAPSRSEGRGRRREGEGGAGKDSVETGTRRVTVGAPPRGRGGKAGRANLKEESMTRRGSRDEDAVHCARIRVTNSRAAVAADSDLARRLRKLEVTFPTPSLCNTAYRHSGTNRGPSQASCIT